MLNLYTGYRRYLTPDDLVGPRDEEASAVLRVQFRDKWAANGNRQGKTALLKTLFKAMPEKFLIPVLPKTMMVAITLTQPMLLQRMLRFVNSDVDENHTGWALVGAFALLYSLTAIFNAWYHHSTNKLAVELRSQLVDACYQHLLRLRLAALDTGNAATLINVDMQHIMTGSLILHDIWSSAVIVAVATYQLYLRLELA